MLFAVVAGLALTSAAWFPASLLTPTPYRCHAVHTRTAVRCVTTEPSPPSLNGEAMPLDEIMSRVEIAPKKEEDDIADVGTSSALEDNSAVAAPVSTTEPRLVPQGADDPNVLMEPDTGDPDRPPIAMSDV